MSAALKPKSKFVVCDGNEAAARAVAAARVDLVAVYPVTPQSSLAEYLTKFVADGRLAAELGRTPTSAFQFMRYWRRPKQRGDPAPHRTAQRRKGRPRTAFLP